MKQKTIVCIIVLCLVVLIAAPVVGAANTVCFTAVNDSLQPLIEKTMPIFIGSQLYMPCDFFTLDELGVYYVPGGTLFLLYSASKKITFSNEDGAIIGQIGNNQYITALKKNGLIYVPFDEVSAYFGIFYDVIQSSPAPVARIYNTPAKYSKEVFINLNKEKMKSYYDEYIRISIEPGVSASPIPSDDVEPTYEDVSVYLSFFNLSGGKLKIILEKLASTDYKACFFVAADEIEANADLLRRAAGKGHTIGIWLNENTKELASKEYQEASALLFEATQVKTVIVTALGGNVKAAEEMAKQKSLVFWRPTRSYDADAKFTVAGLTGKLSTLGVTRDSLYFACSDETSIVLRSFLAYLAQYEYSVRRITETSVPVMTA